MTTCVEKRNGDREPLCIDKIHKMLSYCSDGLDVSISDVAIDSKINFADNIQTKTIQSTLIKAAAAKVSPDNPDYDIFAGRLLASSMCREVYGPKADKMDFFTYISDRVVNGLYSDELINKYSQSDIELLESFIDYDNTFSRGYASIVQLESKYLIKDAITDKLLEMPQEVFMLIPMIIFANEPNRTKLIIEFYTALKNDEISLPTPIIAGVRTQMKMYSSCCKIEMGDTTAGILSSEYALSLMTAKRAGIGIDLSSIRGERAPVGKTVKHTGALPILKTIEASSKQFTQNSLRSGATVVNYQIWNWEIMDILEYKNNQGSNTSRARFIDYSIGLPDIFIDRVLAKEDFTLFSPEEVPELFEHYGDTEKFNAAYVKYEAMTTIRKNVLPAGVIFNKLIKERIGTGRIYIRFDDNINRQGMFKKSIKMTNLCSEIYLKTEPMTFAGLSTEAPEGAYDPANGEIALCILSNINFGKVSNITRLDTLTNLLVRFLDNLIDYQEYPMNAAKYTTLNGRYLGIGISDYAHFLAKNEARVGSKKALNLTFKWTERFQYGLTKASIQLAKEKGPAVNLHYSKYDDGVLPIDTYKEGIHDIITPNFLCDWEGLRNNLNKYGIRNLSLSAVPPSTSSAIVSNSTQGIDPVQNAIEVYEANNFTVKI